MKRQTIIILNDYVKIQCKNGYFLIDKEDLDLYMSRSWRINKKGYVSSSDGKMVFLHREILKAKKNEFVDHKDMIKTDNRKCNLRICTSSENNSNVRVRAGTITGFKGVSLLKKRGKLGAKRYWSYIDKNKKRISLGVFKTPEDAARQYNKYALHYHGEFARLNEI